MLDTLENVKARLNITDSALDVFLTSQINLVSDVIEAYCRRKFTSCDYEQTFYGTDYAPSGMLELFNYPVIGDISITEDGVTLDPTFYRVHRPTGRIVRPASLSSGSVCGNFFLRVDATVVSYTAGYCEVPSPVLSVLDSIIQERYNKQSSGVNLNFGTDVQRISIPGAISIDFDYSIHNNDRSVSFGVILGNNLNILDQYRSERTVLGDSTLSYIEEV